MIATNEELALLKKWKRKLCLQEWRIKLLTHLHPEEMMVRNTAGCHLCMRKVIRERVQLTDFCSHGLPIIHGESEVR